MKLDEVISLLKAHNYLVSEQKRAGNNLGTVLKLSNGCIVNCWDSGKINCQGKNSAEVDAIIHGGVSIGTNRKVFVVYGHDANARTQLEAMGQSSCWRSKTTGKFFI